MGGSGKDDARAKSINIEEASDDEEGGEEGEEEQMDEFQEEKRAKLMVFSTHSKDKDKIVNRLVQSFSKLTINFLDETEMQEKIIRCPQANKSLKIIKHTINEYDDPTTKALSIFLSKSKMVRNNLVSLISISSTDETLMKLILKIVFLLLTPLTTSTKESLAKYVRVKAKGKETVDEAQERADSEKLQKNNALEQVNALLSFKEDFCTEHFIKGLQLVAHKALERNKFKSSRTEEDAKIIELVLKVISYMLSIDAFLGNSTPNEVLLARDLHNTLLKKFQGPLFDLVISFCADMDTKENHELLSIFIDILTNIIRGFAVEDLFDVWRAGHVVSFEKSPEMPVIADSVIYSVDKENNTKQLSEKLESLLSVEKMNREKVAAASLSRNTRLNSIFRTLACDATATTTTSNGQTISIQCERIIKNPFQVSTSHQVALKRSRKTLLFSQNETERKESYCRDQSVIIAAANFIDRLIDSGGFAQVVFRVKEHLRRGDSSIGNDEEDAFNYIAAFCLKYFRMKTELELREAVTTEKWVPRLQYIMLALDRMSFYRATQNLKILMEMKKFSSVRIVMEVYNEMLSYLFLLLSSGDTCHHELAAAALFVIFYRSADKLDPLPTLLRDWKPSLYDRKHVNILVELFHQTMKVLDKARQVFSGHQSRSKKTNKKSKKNEDVSDNYEVALEQYITSVLTFDVNEYFRRLVSNHSVRMYIRVLEKYETNPAKVNHYIFSFLNRIVNFTLDSEMLYTDASPQSFDGVNLGYLLFNIQTLVVFNRFLQDTSFIAAHKYITPLVDMIKNVVRQFFLVAEKNHLLYVEALFQHPHAVDFLQKIDSVYDSASFGRQPHVTASYRESSSKRSRDSIESDDEDDDQKGNPQRIITDVYNQPREKISENVHHDYEKEKALSFLDSSDDDEPFTVSTSVKKTTNIRLPQRHVTSDVQTKIYDSDEERISKDVENNNKTNFGLRIDDDEEEEWND